MERNVAEQHDCAELIMRVTANLHRVLDDETASRCVGVGVFPAACLLNHSCTPTACLSWAEGGRRLQMRAMCDMAAGQGAIGSARRLSFLTPERRELLESSGAGCVGSVRGNTLR